MAKLQVKKRGNVYQYVFEIAPVNGVRKWKSKSGFKTKAEANREGVKAYNKYIQTGQSFVPSKMSYSDYLDYWMKQYCQINLQYRTIEIYHTIIEAHIKPKLGFYRLSQITTSSIQEFINALYVERGFSKAYLKNILKIVKTSFAYAFDVVGFIKSNPALKAKIPKYDPSQETDPVHIFTKEEIDIIFNRFRNSRCVYLAFLTAYHTGLRISEVFGLTWEDIDFEKKTLRVDRNIVKKNQVGGTKKRHLSGKSTGVWYFGPCKTKNSYRTIEIGDTLIKALKEFKEEQKIFEKQYGDMYMKHYAKEVLNPFINKKETKIVNAHAELEVALPEVHLIFLKDNGVFEGTDTCKHPFKVIHYELGIENYKFYDLLGSYATKSLRNGVEIRDVADILGHSKIEAIENYYISTTEESLKEASEKFEQMVKSNIIDETIKYE